MKDPKRNERFAYRNILFMIILVIVFTIYYRHSHVEAVKYSFTRDPAVMTVSSSVSEAASLSFRIRFSDLVDVELMDSLDPGNYISGVNSDKCRFGIWKNDEFGEYRLAVYPKVNKYILMKTDSEIVICNYDSTETTSSLYQAIVKYLDSEMETATQSGMAT